MRSYAIDDGMEASSKRIEIDRLNLIQENLLLADSGSMDDTNINEAVNEYGQKRLNSDELERLELGEEQEQEQEQVPSSRKEKTR
jgi:hypothetical protein